MQQEKPINVNLLRGSEADEIKLKIRVLDKFVAINKSGVSEYNYNFIASMKDWVDLHDRPISNRQASVIKNIWLKVCDKWEDELQQLQEEIQG